MKSRLPKCEELHDNLGDHQLIKKSSAACLISGCTPDAELAELLAVGTAEEHPGRLGICRHHV
jgi:hypothetical protein